MKRLETEFVPLPEPRQLRWHRMETFAIVHFGINTFTSKEWGYGDEDPAIFDPPALDADQWARAGVAAGLKGIILVCKHHDGFCLWPTATTGHSVKKSPWRKGQGDLVAEVSDACRRHGLSFGVYLSPWDRNHPEYGRPGYVEIYHRQLQELLTGYGPLFEVWFDAANGGDGYYGGTCERRSIDAGTYYQWDVIRQMVRKFQPDACMFNCSDIRYIGNERGFAEETCWATYTEDGVGGPEKDHPGIGRRDGKFWMPAECDFPLRQGWFFHPGDEVKQPRKLAEIYFHSVGRGCAMNIGLAPDPRGLICDEDLESLTKWHSLMQQVFREDLLQTKAVRIGEEDMELDGSFSSNAFDTYWCFDEPSQIPILTYEFDRSVTFNLVEIQEDIQHGQRIDSFALEAWVGKSWQHVAAGTSVGYKRLLITPQTETTKVRLRINGATSLPAISKVGIYLAPLEVVLNGELGIKRDRAGLVSLFCTNPGLSIRYTTNGAEPDSSSLLYQKPFALKKGGTVKAYASVAGTGAPRISTLSQTFGCSRENWKAIGVSLESPFENKGAAGVSHLLDDDPSTYWHTYHLDKSKSAPPHEVTFDLGECLSIQAFTLLPHLDEPDGMPDQYEFHLSTDGTTWRLAAAGEFPNIKANPEMKIIELTSPLTARFLRFVALHAIDDADYIRVAGIGVIGQGD